MAKKKGMNFLNFIGLGSSEEPVAQEDMDYEEETPVANRRDSYSAGRSYQREPQQAEPDYGYDNGYEEDYREPAPQAGFALHVHSGTPSGLVLCGEGTFMAGPTARPPRSATILRSPRATAR